MRQSDAHVWQRVGACVAAALALGAVGCGNLDNVTTVKDLRVLAVQSHPGGFLVPLDTPSSLTDDQAMATVTALIVDPKQPNGILTVTTEACPDFIDTITAASGKTSKLCPGRDVTDKLPPPLDTALRTTELPPGDTGPAMDATIEYHPQIQFGLTSQQLGLFFSPQGTGVASIDQSIRYNRDFGVDAIVNLGFTMGNETAAAIKRVVYWPLLAAAELPPAGTPNCPTSQMPNQNPEFGGIDFFRRRDDGIPVDGYDRGAPPTLSLAAMDQLFVQPIFDDSIAELYYLRVRNADTNVVETQCRKELLTFQFFATAGTFTPAERTSELSPVLTPPDNGHIPVDAEWKPPSASELPADGHVTVWVVARDERAGVAWSSRDFVITP